MTVFALTVMYLAISVDAQEDEAADSTPHQVIVHSSNDLTSLDRSEVASFFLEARQAWPDGAEVDPINLPPESPIRASFSVEVVGLDVGKVKANWRRLLFQGKGLPPPERSSEEEILEYVGTRAHAIGYVAADTRLPADVKVLTIINSEE